MKLWNKGYDVRKEIEKFTVGDDYLLDQYLVEFDCKASLAHAKAIRKSGIINEDEYLKLKDGLNEITRLSKAGKFEIKQEDEDCHTAIENYLVRNFGEAGKKIHTGRSRNDQVLTAIRLYEKHNLAEIKKLLLKIISTIDGKIKEYGKIGIPGYTHMQRAMPSSIGMLFEAYTCALKDDMNIIDSALKIIDKSPLGSGAGFGTGLDIDRELTAKEMGFSAVMENPLYCQNSRGKYETMAAESILQVMMDLNKIASDIMLFSMKEFGFFSLPKEICTGSSIMPQKKNPDVLEILRGKYWIVLGYSMQIKSIYGNLISGYNRDVQLSKEPLINAPDLGFAISLAL